MKLVDGDYVPNEVEQDDLRWAMNLAVLSLQGAALNMDVESYCTKVAEMTLNLLATEKLIENEIQ